MDRAGWPGYNSWRCKKLQKLTAPGGSGHQQSYPKTTLEKNVFDIVGERRNSSFEQLFAFLWTSDAHLVHISDETLLHARMPHICVDYPFQDREQPSSVKRRRDTFTGAAFPTPRAHEQPLTPRHEESLLRETSESLGRLEGDCNQRMTMAKTMKNNGQAVSENATFCCIN